MFDSFKDTVKDLSSNVKSTITEKELNEETLEPVLEEFRLKLLQNNVSLETAELIEEEVKKGLLGDKVKRGNVEDMVEEKIRSAVRENLKDDFNLNNEIERSEEPVTIFLVGFNGSGKTTTAAKLSKLIEEQQNKQTVLGAGDTFRAASIEQLQEHGENLGVKVISHEYEADPAAVGYDTVEHAKKNDKIALVDTAGRSHSDKNLMNELEKMIEVNKPDITFLVVDALAGNDVLEQADAYEGVFDAIIVTKTDIDDKGGAALSISHKSNKPIAFLGYGQDYDDLKVFDKEEFVEELF